MRNLVDGQLDDFIHVLCVVLQHDSCEQQRRQAGSSIQMLKERVLNFRKATLYHKETLQAQEEFKGQYRTLLREMPHKLHIVRVMHKGRVGDSVAAASYIAKAICAKSESLQSKGVLSDRMHHVLLGH